MSHYVDNSPMLAIPVLGIPGTGYESLIDAVVAMGYAGVKCDVLGNRATPLFPNLWSYEIMFAWRKLWQKSEKFDRHFLASFGGGNCYELAALDFPTTVALRPLEPREWVKRVAAWRRANAPDLGGLSQKEIQSYARQVDEFGIYLNKIESMGRRRLIWLDTMREPPDLAKFLVSQLSEKGLRLQEIAGHSDELLIW